MQNILCGWPHVRLRDTGSCSDEGRGTVQVVPYCKSGIQLMVHHSLYFRKNKIWESLGASAQIWWAGRLIIFKRVCSGGN
jgi:hypothetical protein